YVAEPRRQMFLLLEITAECEHRHVGRNGELSAELVDVLVVTPGRSRLGHWREPRERRRHHEGARRVRQRVADVAEERLVEFIQALRLVLEPCRVHLT